MTTSFDSVANLSEHELLDHFADLVARDRQTTAELLVAIAEIDERKLWAAHACSSMFTFCMERFHMSEPAAAKRLWAARTARRFPIILEMVARGELHLRAIHLLSTHLTVENHARVLERAKHKSARQVERLVAELAPRADVPSRIRALPGPREARSGVKGVGVAAGDAKLAPEPQGPKDTSLTSSEASLAVDELTTSLLANGVPSGKDSKNSDPFGTTGDQRKLASDDSTVGTSKARTPWNSEPRSAAKPIVPLSPRRYKIEITVDEATHDKLRSLQDLLGRTETGRDPAAIISRALEVLLVRTLARKAACTDRPKRAKAATTPVKGSMAAEPVIRTSPMRVETTTRMSPVTAIPATSAASPVATEPVMRTDAMSARTTTQANPVATQSTTAPAKPEATKPTVAMRATLPAKSEATQPAAAAVPRDASIPAPVTAVAVREPRSRHIPAAVRREVWRRDSGRCCYEDACGRRCSGTSNLEFHHKERFALGGLPTVENIELRCAAHNQFQADLDFGRAFMDAKRGEVSFPGECWG